MPCAGSANAIDLCVARSRRGPTQSRSRRAVQGALGLDELYGADLAARAGGPAQSSVLAALGHEARVMVDAGVDEVAAVRQLLELGAARIVIGTETLPDQSALERLQAELPDAPLVLSLDVRAGGSSRPKPSWPARSGEALDRLGAPA